MGLATSAILLAMGAPAPMALPLAQVTVRERVIIKVQTLQPLSGRAAPKPVRWKEAKGPRCLPARQLAGAALNGRESVDLVLRGGARYRARLEGGCRAIDFYRGFYLKPHRDGQLCADRDSVHDRSGNQCELTGFRTLTRAR